MKSIIVGLIWGGLAWAKVATYPSGLPSRWDFDPPVQFATQEKAVEDFLKENFSSYPIQWKERERIEDFTHFHLSYELEYQGIEVLDAILKIHFNKKGYVDFASSSWSQPISLEPDPFIKQKSVYWERDAKQKILRKHNSFNGIVNGQPVIWMGPPVRYAVRLRVASNKPVMRRDDVLDPLTGKLFFRRKPFRSISNEVYLVHPDRESNTTTNKTLGNLTVANTKLEDSNFHVSREQDANTIERVDVDPNTDYTALGTQDIYEASPNPDLASPIPASNQNDYNWKCDTGSGTANCSNQQFDAVNVYYHLRSFRDNLDSYLTTLGVTPSFSLDPITVVVNTLSIDSSQDDGSGLDEINNAFYVENLQLGGVFIDGGLFFLRPAGPVSVSGTSCVGINFYDLAREGIVIAHEYQHYITDKIANFIPGSEEVYNVGDALHEAYSDYFGASQTSRNSGQTVTVIGEYAFQECTVIQRNVGTLVPYNAAEEYSIPHNAGLPFATGLWELRDLLGREIADLLVLKSLFFMPVAPTFADAIESLVRADISLNGGVNTATIRSVLYDEVRLGDNIAGIFSDPANYIAELGFKSCAVSPVSRGGSLSLVFLALWLCGILWLGRKIH